VNANSWKDVAGIDKLVGLCGVAGSGKSLAADMTTKCFPYYRYSFARPLKDAVSMLFNIPREHLDNEAAKQFLSLRWNMTNREIMQIFGTEAMRDNFGSDFWLKQAEMRLTDVAKRGAVCGRLCVVIDDVRFPNEIAWVKASGGSIIYIERDGVVATGDHASEQIVFPDMLERNEYYIHNNNTSDFHERVVDTVRTITYLSQAW